MSIHKKLRELQKELHVPKNQFNKFGGYSFRSLEDILEALKKCETDLVPHAKTEPVSISDKVFIKATVILTDSETSEFVFSESHVELPHARKGMSSDQSTGAAISYALKYAWGQLLCIDDVKDADTRPLEDSANEKKQLINEVVKVVSSMKEEDRKSFCGKYQIKSEMLKTLSIDELKEILVLARK